MFVTKQVNRARSLYVLYTARCLAHPHKQLIRKMWPDSVGWSTYCVFNLLAYFARKVVAHSTVLRLHSLHKRRGAVQRAMKRSLHLPKPSLAPSGEPQALQTVCALHGDKHYSYRIASVSARFRWVSAHCCDGHHLPCRPLPAAGTLHATRCLHTTCRSNGRRYADSWQCSMPIARFWSG